MSLARPEERSSSAAQGTGSALSTCAQQAVDARITPFMRFVVEHGCLAPSGGNCQPWKFYAEDSRLWVVHDRVRSKNLLDADHRGSYLALGAAIENICIAAAHRGFSVAVESFPGLANSAVAARLSFSAGDAPRIHEGGRFEALRRRVTNRQRGTPVSLDERARRGLSDAVEQLGVSVHFVEERDALAQLGTIVGECDRLRFLCPALHDEMMRELRWTLDDAERTRNGLALDTLGLTTAQMAALRLAARSDVANVLRTLDAGRGLAKLSIDALTSSSAVGLISSADLTPGDLLRVGRGFERLWLDATVLEISLQPLGAVTAMFRMLRTDAGDVLQPPEQVRLRELELAFYRLFPGVVPDSGLMLFRLSNAAAPTARSVRLPLRDVLFAGQPEGLKS